jgi:hypothetical protein
VETCENAADARPSGGVAWVREIQRFDRRGPVALGRFAGEVLGGSALGVAHEYTDGELTLPEAVSWARSRADRVSVSIAGLGTFSAGRVLGSDPPLDESITLHQRRAPGWEFADRSDDDPVIAWDVVIEVSTQRMSEAVGPGGWTRLGMAWRRELDRVLGCHVISTTGHEAGERFHHGDGWYAGWAATRIVVVRVKVSSHRQARQAATNAGTTAARQVGWEPPPMFSVNHAFASGSVAALQNARLDVHGTVY